MTALIIHPSVTTKVASPKMSERYVHIDSHAVVELMRSEGFQVASVTTPKQRKDNGRDPLYIRHQIDFRREGWDDHTGSRGVATPRMLFTNSHDGTTAASFMLGVYSFVCSNGMVVGSTYAREKVRHAGETAAELLSRMQSLAKNTGPLFDQIDRWQEKRLTAPQANEFARLAATLRWGDPHRFDASEVLRVRRAEDDGDSLWAVFNRVQENTVRGGIEGLASTGRRAVARPLSEIGHNTKFNADLWRLAEEFATL
jgi:hypothetical protein